MVQKRICPGHNRRNYLRALCCVFLPAPGSRLCPWKILLAWMTDCYRAAHRLLLWEWSLSDIFWVTGTICPYSWGKTGWCEQSSGMQFSFLFGIPEFESAVGWWGGWFRITCFVPCSAVNSKHNLLWFTYCIAGDIFFLQSRQFKNIIFFPAIQIGLDVA